MEIRNIVRLMSPPIEIRMAGHYVGTYRGSAE